MLSGRERLRIAQMMVDVETKHRHAFSVVRVCQQGSDTCLRVTQSVPRTPTTVVMPASRKLLSWLDGVHEDGPASPPPPMMCTCRSTRPGVRMHPGTSKIHTSVDMLSAPATCASALSDQDQIRCGLIWSPCVVHRGLFSL